MPYHFIFSGQLKKKEDNPSLNILPKKIKGLEISLLTKKRKNCQITLIN